MNLDELLKDNYNNWHLYKVSINDVSGEGFDFAQKIFRQGASIIVPNVNSERLSKVISELSGSMTRYKVVPQPTIHLEQVDLLINFNKEPPNGHAAKQVFNVQSIKVEPENNSETTTTPKRGRPVRRNTDE